MQLGALPHAVDHLLGEGHGRLQEAARLAEAVELRLWNTDRKERCGFANRQQTTLSMRA